jgi:RNA polymerase sigma-70 factor (ECF subfamily)
MAADFKRKEPHADREEGMMGHRAAPPPRPYEAEGAFAGALAERDPAAWRLLFEEQYQRVYAYAYARTGSAHDAEDVASNTFAEAVRGIGRFQFRGAPVAAWLLRIAHNETVDLLKRRARQPASSIEREQAAWALRAPDDVPAREEWREIRDALGALKREHREVITLRLIEGRSIAETAVILQKTEAAIKVLQMRALQSLRRRMKE